MANLPNLDGKNIFDQLKIVGRFVEVETNRLKSRVEDKNVEPHAGELLIMNMNKELQDMKGSLGDIYKDMRKQSAEFESMTALAQEVIEWQQKRVTKLKERMMEYGYKPNEKPAPAGNDVSQAQLGAVSDDLSMEDTGSGKENLNIGVDKPLMDDGDTDDLKFPRLEDMASPGFFERRNGRYFLDSGPESITANVDKVDANNDNGTNAPRLEDMASPGFFARRAEYLQIEKSRLNSSASDSGSIVENIPLDFRHKGLTVTPGVFDGKNMETPVQGTRHRKVDYTEIQPYINNCNDDEDKPVKPELSMKNLVPKYQPLLESMESDDELPLKPILSNILVESKESDDELPVKPILSNMLVGSRESDDELPLQPILTNILH